MFKQSDLHIILRGHLDPRSNTYLNVKLLVLADSGLKMGFPFKKVDLQMTLIMTLR